MLIYYSKALERSKILLVLITLSVLWGSSFLAIKTVIDVIPPLLAFGIRFAIAGAALLIVHAFTKRHHREKNEQIGKQHWKDTLIVAALIIVGGQGLLVWGAQYLSSGMTALLNSTIPLWVAIIGYLIYKKRRKGGLGQRLTKSTIIGLSAGFAGLMILINPFVGNVHLNLIGVISLTLSSIFWAIGSLYSTRLHLQVSILVSAGMLMLVGGLMLVAASLAVGEFKSLQLSRISIGSLTAYSYLIFLCTAVGYAEFFWLLQAESESIANSFAYIVPVIAVFLGWVILKEPISTQTLIATSIIMLGVALMVTSSSKKAKNKMIEK
jgi:drug/metabolite transporter (DMT)-like permease